MVSFEEYKLRRIKNMLDIIRGTDPTTANGENIKIKCNYIIDNIDEIAIIDIGFAVNKIISDLTLLFKNYKKLYLDYFDEVIKESFLPYSAEMDVLGLKTDDLKCFNGVDPNSLLAGDFFRKIMSINFGFVIPSSVDVKNVKDRLDICMKNGNTKEICLAYVNLVDVQKRSGKLKRGTFDYQLPSNNRVYQSAMNVLQESKEKSN